MANRRQTLNGGRTEPKKTTQFSLFLFSRVACRVRRRRAENRNEKDKKKKRDKTAKVERQEDKVGFPISSSRE
jgi:hypothetical protein